MKKRNRLPTTIAEEQRAELLDFKERFTSHLHYYENPDVQAVWPNVYKHLKVEDPELYRLILAIDPCVVFKEPYRKLVEHVNHRLSQLDEDGLPNGKPVPSGDEPT